MVTETQIKEKALELGFHGVGIASVDSQDSAVSHLKSWLERGDHADMDWMTNPKRQDIKTLWPEVRSLICLALNYYTPQQHSQEQNHGKISRYAWGRDYHKVLSKKLKALSQWLESQGEQIQTRYYVDTGPVQD